MDAIQVNGISIPEAAIRAEAQNHPAPSPDAAVAAAREALVVRELLRQEAQARGLAPDPQRDADGRREADDDAVIRRLVETEVTVPEADDETCRRYFDNNRAKFRSPDLFEAAHILYAADPQDAPAYGAAVTKAAGAIARIAADPSAFAGIARAESACTSARDGGRLGQVARGDTVPEFETFLAGLEEGQLCPVPVKSRYGAHVLRLDRRIAGKALPFEAVRERVAAQLHEASWRRAVTQYIRMLAGRASLKGIDLGAAAGPLVQ